MEDLPAAQQPPYRDIFSENSRKVSDIAKLLQKKFALFTTKVNRPKPCSASDNLNVNLMTMISIYLMIWNETHTHTHTVFTDVYIVNSCVQQYRGYIV